MAIKGFDTRPEHFIKNLQTVSSASAMELPENHFPDETFYVSGTEAIDFVKNGGRSPGNRVNLIFTDAATLSHNSSAAPSGFAPVYVTDEAGAHDDHAVVVGIIYTLVFDGTQYRVNVYTGGE